LGVGYEKRGKYMETATEHCKNCGSIVYAFSKKTATSDGSSYCIKCAEELDSQYIKKNVCSVCTKLLEKQEIKFVLPSRMFSSYFFDKLPLETRLMCASCYSKAEKLNLVRRPLIKIGQIRTRLMRRLERKAIIRSRSSE
jgi:hypothetical protein